jgi:hypothetical protein
MLSHLIAVSAPGTRPITVTRPAPTRTIMSVKPIATPSMCGTVRAKPKLVPDVISIRLFGPGVIDEIRAKAVSAKRSDGVMARAL